ncbi:MAG: phosphomannomutase/phosphoglucomutase [Gammaproteobacteria bacterium]
MRRIFSMLSVTSILVLTIAGIGIYWKVSSEIDRIKQASAEMLTQGVVAGITTKIVTLDQLLGKLSQDPEVLLAVSHNNSVLMAAASAKMERIIPGAQKIRLLLPGVNEVDDKNRPRMSYADLEMVRGAFSSAQLPAIHGDAPAERHLALTQIITQNDKPIGVILASVDYDFIHKNLQTAMTGEGYLEIKQDKLILAASGNEDNLQDVAEISFKIPETRWELRHLYPLHTAERMATIAGALGIAAMIILAVTFFEYRKLFNMLVHDLNSVKSAIKDMMLNKLKRQYPVQLKEFNIVLSSLSQFEGDRDNESKIKTIHDEDFNQSGLSLKNPGINTPLLNQKNTNNKPEAVTNPPPPFDEEKTSAKELANIFRAYDIRGIVGDSLTPDVVFDIGLALGTEAREHGCHMIVIGRDGRTSSRSLADSLAQGIISTGCNVLDIGMGPTPLLYFVASHIEGRCGVMITGSHNPPEYNGLKMMIKGETLAGERIQKLKQCIDIKAFATGNPGTIEHNDSFSTDYIGTISEDIHIARPLKVVIDSGNGVAGDIGPILLRTIGCQVIELNCEIDGTFPNHHPDPSKPENLEDLITAVKEYQADLGIAFDGDGDRLGVVDSGGKIIWPDRQMMLFAKDVLAGKPGAEIIFDVKCSRHLATEIAKYGGRPVMSKTGHSFMKAKLKETGAKLAGEMSGHIFFNDRWFGFDDALYSAARLIEILSADTRSSQEIFANLPDSINTPELNVDMAEGENFVFIEELKGKSSFPGGKITTIDGLRVDFPDGWGLVRASNTTPSLVIRFEADTVQALKTIQAQFRQQMVKIKPTIALPF